MGWVWTTLRPKRDADAFCDTCGAKLELIDVGVRTRFSPDTGKRQRQEVIALTCRYGQETTFAGHWTSRGKVMSKRWVDV